MLNYLLVAALAGSCLIVNGCASDAARIAAAARETQSVPAAHSDPEGWSAIYLTNSLVVIGKLKGLGTHYPELTEVYYLRPEMDPQTKTTRTRLVKRGHESHRPKGMTINRDHILFIEDVAEDSPVANMIRDAQKLPQASQQ